MRVLFRPAFAALLGVSLCAPAAEITLRPSTNRVERYQKLEFDLGVPGAWSNPFDPEQIAVNLVVTVPSGESVVLPAFFHQAYARSRVGGRDWFYPKGLPTWKARFAVSAPGSYSAVAISICGGVTNRSVPVAFECLAGSRPGYLRVSKTDPRFLEFSTGKAFFPMGQNLAFIGDQQYVSLSKAEEIFRKLNENGANYLRIWTCCDDWAMAIEARKSAWGRSWDWRPSITNVPGEKLKALWLAKQSLLRVQPSHSLALRPDTNYRFAAKVRPAGAATSVRVRISPGKVEQDIDTKGEGNWSPLSCDFRTGPQDYWLNEMSLQTQGNGEAWVRDVSLKEYSGGPELLWEADPNRPVLGFYNPLDCYLLDELIAAAETNGIYLQLCLLTRDLYMNRLKDPATPEYDQAIADARTTFRYAIARWGYSTSVAAWEYWNEMNPGLPTDRFYAEVGDYLAANDPYRHLRTTSTWGPSAKDCRHPQLDFADAHFYLRPSDKGKLEDEVHAVIARTAWLREQAPHKPAHLGEFGLADEKWGLTDQMKRSPELADVHNVLWASALSGASGTAMFWWWERLDQQSAYAAYRPLSQFIRDIPWTSGQVQVAAVSSENPRVRAMGLRAARRAWLWTFNKQASWNNLVDKKEEPAIVEGSRVDCVGLPDGDYLAKWFDTKAGTVTQIDRVMCRAGHIDLRVPAFARDIACTVE